jgi:D-alanyl-D-alanine carboxypeptidase
MTACGAVSEPAKVPVKGTQVTAPSQGKLPLPFVAVTRAISPSLLPSTPTHPLLATHPPRPTIRPFPLPTANLLLGLCSERKPADDDLLTVVTSKYGLSSKYIPPDLVPLDKYLPYNVVYADAIIVRSIVTKPVAQMIKAMKANGLHPIIRSAYRSYAAQTMARQKWEQQQADRANIISALPGHSEHQLGVALDFGSPELAEIVGDPSVEFHTDFDRTSEGIWLAGHAHEYGFSMSYPLFAYQTTGFAYEPWHYRYVGVELATYLWDTNQFLTKFLLKARSVAPCIP